MDENDLLEHCRQEKFRGSGRGGQKRNVTDSAVRLTHTGSGISAESDKTRSQHDNRKIALRLLREEIAHQWREQPPDPENVPERPGRHNRDYPLWVASILDILEKHEWQIGAAARYCELSTGKLVKLLANDKKLWQTVNQKRQQHNLRTLRTP